MKWAVNVMIKKKQRTRCADWSDWNAITEVLAKWFDCFSQIQTDQIKYKT